MSEEISPEQWRAEFARRLPAVQSPPPSNVTALGEMLSEWLKSVIADADTEVDVGGGFGSYDLWVKMGGEEIYIALRHSNAQQRKSSGAA